MTTISVTAEHIAKGERDSCRFCPVARAISEALPDIELVAVDSAYASFGHPDAWPRCREIALPDPATRFIEAFDAGDPVKPFTFELDYPKAAAA
jgi:hypothetical protein